MFVMAPPIIMKIVSGILVLAAYAFGAPSGSQGFLSTTFARQHTNISSKVATGFHKAASRESNNGVSETLKNTVIQYLVSFEIGSPGQRVTSSLDTGSSDLWVYSGEVSQAPQKYSSNSSSTSKYISDDFAIQYVDGSGAKGSYYSDSINWGGTSFDLQFAVTDEYEEGLKATVFGVGFKPSEATTDRSTYNNLPYALKDQGIISSALYSLNLNGSNSASGTFLLGAIDDSRYEGKLNKIPFTSNSSFDVDFMVNGKRMNGVLDSGTSLTYLDDDVVSSIAERFGANYDVYQGLYIINGDVEGNDVDFSFFGTNITVPASELVIDQSGVKTFGLVPSSQAANQTILGDTFLRSAYVVYDLDNKQAGIAQANYNSNSPSIRVIGSEGF